MQNRPLLHQNQSPNLDMDVLSRSKAFENIRAIHSPKRIRKWVTGVVIVIFLVMSLTIMISLLKKDSYSDIVEQNTNGYIKSSSPVIQYNKYKLTNEEIEDPDDDVFDNHNDAIDMDDIDILEEDEETTAKSTT
jgi:hypothetical protein